MAPLTPEEIDALRASDDETVQELVATIDELVRLVRWFTTLRIHDMADALREHGDPDAAALLERIALHADPEEQS